MAVARLGMLLVGALSPVRAAILAVVQILGAITGAAIIQALTPGPCLTCRACRAAKCTLLTFLLKVH